MRNTTKERAEKPASVIATVLIDPSEARRAVNDATQVLVNNVSPNMAMPDGCMKVSRRFAVFVTVK